MQQQGNLDFQTATQLELESLPHIACMTPTGLLFLKMYLIQKIIPKFEKKFSTGL